MAVCLDKEVVSFPQHFIFLCQGKEGQVGIISALRICPVWHDRISGREARVFRGDDLANRIVHASLQGNDDYFF